MTVSGALQPVADIESFILDYYAAWGGTDEDRILSYHAENVTVQIPGTLMQGRAALREHFVRPFITAFPGNRHILKNLVFGRDFVVVEFTFEAEHKGVFADRAPTGAPVKLPGCGVYECDLAKRQITAARVYFDIGTLLKQISDQRQAHTRTEPTAPASAMAEHLDLGTVIAVSQSISGEMVLEKLLDTLMRTAIMYAGAERALLILSRETEQRIVAEAAASNGGVTVDLRDDPVTGSLLPETILSHVLQTRQSVILDDAAAPSPFLADPYFAQRHARSVFCLPLMNQAKLIGALFLENNLALGVFAPARTSVLKLLASQAAVSLENSRLYRDLAERESRIRRLVNVNIIGIFTWHADGRVFDANDAFLRIIGYSRDDIVSGRLRWTDFTLQESRESDLRLLEHMQKGGQHEPVERELLKKDGTRVPVLAGGTMFDENEGAAFVFDMTERKRAEQALRESERESQLIVHTIPGLVAMLTPSGEVDFVNKELVEYCGQQLEAMKQWGTNGTVQAEDLPRVGRDFAQAVTTGEPYDFEMRVRRFDGVYRWFQVRGLPLRDSGGQIVRWYVLLSDIEDRKRAESELRRTQERFADAQRVAAMSTLTASIAHEVNQPLSGIITNAGTCLRMLDADPPNVDGARETARRTIRDGNRAANVITRLRALFAKKELTLEPVDLNEATREVIALSSHDLQRSGVLLEEQLAQDLPSVTGDRIQLQQVVLNLIRNACEAMAGIDDRPRRLLIRTEREQGDRVRVTVRDDGVGLEPQSIDKLFDTFYTTKSGGMGVGLSVSRSIVERHRGRLWAEPNDGPGATFSLSVPILRALDG
jgi:PAS domain S-box-containing protein